MMILKRTEQGYREPLEMKWAVVRGTRAGMLMTTSGGVGDKESRIRRIMTELNRNQNPNRVQS